MYLYSNHMHVKPSPELKLLSISENVVKCIFYLSFRIFIPEFLHFPTVQILIFFSSSFIQTLFFLSVFCLKN